MLTSRDESRFAAGKGVVFLDQLGGVLSRRVRALHRVRVADVAASDAPPGAGLRDVAASGRAVSDSAAS